MSRDSRRYGYYRCDCGRTWRSAHTWCYHGTKQPKDAQDCSNCYQAVYAFRVEYLKVPKPDEIRNDDLTKNHIQELCHRCRNKPFPCSSNSYHDIHDNDYLNIDNYQIHQNEDDQDDDDDDDEDDDLYIAIKNSLLDSYHNNNNNTNNNNNNNRYTMSDDNKLDSNDEEEIEEQSNISSNHNNDNFLDLCSDSNGDNNSDDNEIDTISIVSNQNSIGNNGYNEEYEQSQWSEAQSAMDLMSNIEYTQSQPQTPYICHRNDNDNKALISKTRKRSRYQMESDDKLDQYELMPLHKKRRISNNDGNTKTIQNIAKKYGWNEISAVNMISFKKRNQRLNVWRKIGGLLSMRIQPMGYSKKNISLDMFEKLLSEMNINDKKEIASKQEPKFIITQEMRNRMEANRMAALERRRKRREELSQITETETKLTQEQKEQIERKRQEAIKRRAAWRAKQQCTQ